jgi:hypothetical protein
MFARVILALAAGPLGRADAATSDEGAELEQGVALAGFVTLLMNASAAYAAIQNLITVPGGITLGIGTPTEGTIAGINLGTMGRIMNNPAKVPSGSLTVTNATVISINNGVATEIIVTTPDSTTITPAGVVLFNPGA